MTLLARTAWFILGVGMLIGAMLLTVHFAHAAQANDERAPIPPEIEETFCKADRHSRACELSVARQQIGMCIEYGDAHKRTTPDRRDDWLYFCMQQKHWQLCDDCFTLQDGTPSCKEAGTAAYYSESCWTFIPRVPGRYFRPMR